MQHFFKEIVRKNTIRWREEHDQYEKKGGGGGGGGGGYMILQFLIVTTCRIAC